MSARHVLLLCFALCACKTSEGTSLSMNPAGSMDGGQSNDAGASSANTGSDSGSVAAPVDDRLPTPTEEDLLIEQTVKRRLVECGLINKPDLPVGLEHIRDAHGRCFGRCFLEPTLCTDIWETLCGTGNGDTGAGDRLVACLNDCEAAPEDGFLCKDGTRIPHIFLCDQATDCASGEDEGARCSSHTCANGEALKNVGDIVCDIQQDCSDGSDETGCGYDCATEPKPECWTSGAIRCNGEVDCTDEADEKDCVDVRCDGGFNLVEASQVCDGIEDCLDGADEKGCP